VRTKLKIYLKAHAKNNINENSSTIIYILSYLWQVSLMSVHDNYTNQSFQRHIDYILIFLIQSIRQRLIIWQVPSMSGHGNYTNQSLQLYRLITIQFFIQSIMSRLVILDCEIYVWTVFFFVHTQLSDSMFK